MCLKNLFSSANLIKPGFVKNEVTQRTYIRNSDCIQNALHLINICVLCMGKIKITLNELGNGEDEYKPAHLNAQANIHLRPAYFSGCRYRYKMSYIH